MQTKPISSDNNDEIIDSSVTLDESPSVDGRRPSSPTPLKYCKSSSIQATVFSGEAKKSSLSVTTQMLGKLQDNEIKKFLTGLGNLTKSCELPYMENYCSSKKVPFNEKEVFKVQSTSNAICSQDTCNNSMDCGNVDTILISKQAKQLMNKSCVV